MYNGGMRIALLGYGQEGQATEKYFKSHYNDVAIDILQNFTIAEAKEKDYSAYDMIFRSPSVPPLGLENELSVTRYFFEHCPCPIIGVTATKGKGTICSFIRALLEAEGEKVHLVGNIGAPAIEILDEITEESVVVYELSSFQLWDLEISPHVAVLGQLEPDHLDVHRDYTDYLAAKSHITKYQSKDDYLVYYATNEITCRIAEYTNARKVKYPFKLPKKVRKAIRLPGRHNCENAMAAIAAVASYYNISPDEYLQTHESEILKGLVNFCGLPHRLELVRKIDNVRYYDDNFSTNIASTRVAVEAFPKDDLIMIIGGRDKTDYADLAELYEILAQPQVKKIILMGESGFELAKRYQDERFYYAGTLGEAVAMAEAQVEAGDFAHPVVLMSPAAASFDMFENVYDRGEQFKALVDKL